MVAAEGGLNFDAVVAVVTHTEMQRAPDCLEDCGPAIDADVQFAAKSITTGYAVGRLLGRVPDLGPVVQVEPTVRCSGRVEGIWPFGGSVCGRTVSCRLTSVSPEEPESAPPSAIV